MSAEKREERLNELRIELSKLRAMAKISSTSGNPSQVKEIKRAIARILTVENEEKLGVKAEK